jgi:transcriptional regulator GlxA family with amidase domain
MSIAVQPDSRILAHSMQQSLRTLETPQGKPAVLPFPQPGALARGGLPPRALQRVLDYVEAHLEKNISIQALSEIAGVSKFHFARTFKRSKGMTPHEYTVLCRIRRTRQLLSETDMPVSEIALASGFSDQSHCARRFREAVGLTPSQYRRSER